jgi:dCTP deaminase
LILSGNRIADLLERPTSADDPLVIAPQPDLKELRDRGPASIDLRLGCWFAVLRQARACVLDVGDNPTGGLSERALTKTHYVRFGDKFILHPRSFVLGSTLEWVRLPKDIAGYVTSRSKWGRRGLIIATATGVHPRFTGCLTLELFNSGEIPIALYPGMTVCQFFLHSVEGSPENVTGGAMAGRRKPFLGAIELDEVAKRIASDV